MPPTVVMRIEQRGSKWVVLPEAGDKVLGTHDTKEEAEAQLKAIEANKHTMSFATVPAFRFSLDLTDGLDGAIGKWSRGATFGYKGAKGNGLDFTIETLGQMVDNAAARGDKISICQDHLSILGPPIGVPAPSLGFFYALALFKDGELLKHWSYDGGDPPPGVDEKGQPRNGLYCRLGEITPLGRDPKEGLANYSSLSPSFPPPEKATDEAGNPIGYALLDFAATSTPFQSGCELQLHALTTHPEAPRALTTGASMDPEMMKKLGFADGVEPKVDEKMATYSKHAFGEASPEEIAKMAEDLEKHEEPEAKAMAVKLRKMSKMDAADGDPVPGEEGEKPKGLDQTLPRGSAEGEAQNAAIHIKTGQEHNGMGSEADEAKAMGALAASLRSRGVIVPPNANRAVLMSLAASAPAPAVDDEKIAKMVAAQIQAQREAEEKAATEKEAAQLVAMARAAKAPPHEITALEIVAKQNIATARQMASKYSGHEAPAHLFSRVTSQGGPIGAGGARDFSGPKGPSVQKTKAGTVIVSADAELADKAIELADSKDPVIMSRIEQALPTKSDRENPALRLLAAQKLAAEMFPDLAAEAERAELAIFAGR